MITSKILQFSGGTAPYTYNIVADSCILIDFISGVLKENEVKFVTFNMTDGCNPNIVINVTDAKGCTNNIQKTLLNICNSFNVGITQNNYTFSTFVTGGSGVYTYEWIYDKTKFTALNNTSVSIELLPVGQQVISDVVVVVKDSNGCQTSAKLLFQPCVGTLRPVMVDTYCTKFQYVTETIELKYQGCGIVDWNTLSIVALQGLNNVIWSYDVTSTVGNSVFIIVKISNKSNIAPTIVKLSAAVKNIFGITTENVEIKINVKACLAVESGVTAVGTKQKASAIIGFQFIKHLPDYVLSDKELDWNQFTLIASTGQTLNNKTNLTVQAGSVTLNDNRDLIFEIFNAPTKDIELVRWRIKDIEGNVSNTAEETYILTQLALPVVASDSLCLLANQLLLINSIFVNDANYVLSSFTVVSQPVHGTILTEGTNYYYKPNLFYIGSDSFTYKIGNPDGVFSNIATVTLTIISSGILINQGNNNIC